MSVATAGRRYNYKSSIENFFDSLLPSSFDEGIAISGTYSLKV